MREKVENKVENVVNEAWFIMAWGVIDLVSEAWFNLVWGMIDLASEAW